MVQSREGQRGVSERAQRSADQRASDQLPETAESLFGQGIADSLAAGTFLDEDDEDRDPGTAESDDPDELERDPQERDDEQDDRDLDDDDPEGDPEDDADEGDDPDAHKPAEKPAAKQPATKRSAAEWGKLIATEGPQRVAEVPNKALRDPEYVRALRDETARQAAASTRAEITQHLKVQETYKQFVADVEANFDGDPDGLLAWIQTDPQGPVYSQAKQLAATFEQQAPEERVAAADAVAQLNARSRRQFERLAKYPDSQAELIRRQEQEQRYPTTEDGLAQLERDVDELFTQGLERPGQGGGQGERRDAPPERPRAARPIVGGGSAEPRGQRRDGPDISKQTDPAELFSNGIVDSLAAAQRGRGRGRRR